MKRKTYEKEMTISQQLGMVTLKNTMRVFADYGVDFQIFTRESEEVIVKEFSRIKAVDTIDANGELFMDAVTEIAFRFPKNEEAKIWFYNLHDEIIEVDCFKGFEVITSTFMNYGE